MTEDTAHRGREGRTHTMRSISQDVILKLLQTTHICNTAVLQLQHNANHTHVCNTTVLQLQRDKNNLTWCVLFTLNWHCHPSNMHLAHPVSMSMYHPKIDKFRGHSSSSHTTSYINTYEKTRKKQRRAPRPASPQFAFLILQARNKTGKLAQAGLHTS